MAPFLDPTRLGFTTTYKTAGTAKLRGSRTRHRMLWVGLWVGKNSTDPAAPPPSFPRTPSMVRVSTRCRLRDAAFSYQQQLRSLRMVTPRAESSPSNCATPGEVSRSPGTMTVHSRFSRNSFDLICHCPKDDDFASPIWKMDQCRTNVSAAGSSGNGPHSIKWLFPCTRIPTIRSQASRRGSATGYPIAKW
jgi:hypothetical protein